MEIADADAKLTIVIPCYNEEKRIKRSIEQIIAYLKDKNYQSELIFVNDGSTDTTLKLLKKFVKQLDSDSCIRPSLISYSQNRGKGYAIKKGLLRASGEYILLSDADLSTPITELDKFLPYAEKKDLVVGSRRKKGAKVVEPQSFARVFLGRCYSFLSKLILNVAINDFTCGFKLIKRGPAKNIARKLTIDRWAYDSELLKIASVSGYSIKEIGIVWYNDKNSKVKLSSDILSSFVDLCKIAFYSIIKKYG